MLDPLLPIGHFSLLPVSYSCQDYYGINPFADPEFGLPALAMTCVAVDATMTARYAPEGSSNPWRVAAEADTIGRIQLFKWGAPERIDSNIGALRHMRIYADG